MANAQNNKSTAFIHWTSAHNYTTKLNYDGRGMELSDLKYYNGKLLAVDDKTGVIFRLDGKKAIPWAILSQGDSTVEGFFKGEWFTVKDGNLYCGSNGKEWTTPTGEYVNDNPMYVKRISPEGGVEVEDWVQRYITLRAAIDIHFPGYIIHEAVQWSDLHKVNNEGSLCTISMKFCKWFFLPRHLSKYAYNDETAQKMGTLHFLVALLVLKAMHAMHLRTNVLLIASDDMKEINAVSIGQEVATRGFSAFQFVPGTDDSIIVALKTEEVDGKPLSSYIMVFSITGNVILDETRIPENYKYEGIEFLYEEVLKNLIA
ncbi:unnamed protein product [Strongylus vulgaris]|uniref:Apyrase n=1 Tax=Strongylus vulgaris TaxID=40348 RepID=A0A3P7JHV9_STRVU|nr:unnamed protein product [Strongylus vulgaris]